MVGVKDMIRLTVAARGPSAGTIRPGARRRTLDDVRDPKTRAAMEIVLEEDRDFIEYLADR
jgi:hypothetical protein